MKCPFCQSLDDKVVDSRPADGNARIRRRRECNDCGRRYTTYEQIEMMPLRVVKKDGSRVEFDRQNIYNGILKACEKRSVPTVDIEIVCMEIEKELRDRFDKEVTSRHIGQIVMRKLRSLDKVAYVRFASVYREFEDVSEFVEEVRPMLDAD